MALSPELKLMVSGQAIERDGNDDLDIYEPPIREQLAWLGLQKATRAELREIIVNAMARNRNA
jgi:hypothetical protein